LPAQVRSALFARGPAFAIPDLLHPRTRDDLLTEAANELGLAVEQVEALLYADRHCHYLLTEGGPSWTPTDLITRYNLELSRAALYWSDGLQVTIHDTFKDFWRYLKLFKLMFWATPNEGGYRIEVDGPLSPFVSATTRYGRQLAAFLPALLLCQRWQMQATVRPPHFDQRLVYRLDDTAPLTTHFRRSGAFDSRLESDFAAEFETKFGDERGQWQLTREDELLLLGDTVMIPDFAFTHKRDGRRALVEIVGYWHPEYLRRKVAKVRAAQRSDLILLVYEGVNLAKEKLQGVPGEVLYFQNKPVLKEVMAAVERAAI
jgi:predicted nuclease of restriction endonuclease-like RecB superfamily